MTFGVRILAWSKTSASSLLRPRIIEPANISSEAASILRTLMELQSFLYRTCTGLSMRGFFEARLSLVHNISFFFVVLFVFSAFVVPQFNKNDH